MRRPLNRLSVFGGDRSVSTDNFRTPHWTDMQDFGYRFVRNVPPCRN